MARYSKLGLLVSNDPDKAKVLIEMVLAQESSIKASAKVLQVSAQTLRQLATKCGISVRAQDADLDQYVNNVIESYQAAKSKEEGAKAKSKAKSKSK